MTPHALLSSSSSERQPGGRARLVGFPGPLGRSEVQQGRTGYRRSSASPGIWPTVSSSFRWRS